MDNSKINQTELDYSCGIGNAKLNLYNGRLLYEFPCLAMGASSFQIGSTLIYNNNYLNSDYNGRKIGIGNGWKINLQQYLFPYETIYNLDGFSETNGDYVYIDSNWGLHRFVKYVSSAPASDFKDVYYDANGTGLKLVINEDNQLKIYDGNNVIEFNEYGNISKIISGINSNIVKNFLYDENGNLISVYDIRKPQRKMVFEYDSNKYLNKIKVTGSNVSLSTLYENNLLVTVSKYSSNNNKDILYLKYDSNNSLIRIINAESLKALEFNYNLFNRIVIIKNGVMKEIICTESSSQEIYLGDDNYIGDDYYITKNGKKIIGRYYSMPSNYIKNTTRFDYNGSYTDVINDKNIVTRYYFNVNGFNISILENDGLNNKTMFKTSGWRLSDNGTSQYSINSEKANILNNYLYKAINDKLEKFALEFKNYSNGEDSKYKYSENFVVSFWLKVDKDITENAKANLYVKRVRDRWLAKDTIQEINENVYLSHAKANAWQYITIPVNLGEKQYNIDEISISFNNLSSGSIVELADMRIAIGGSSKIVIYDEENQIDMSDVTSYSLFHKDINHVIEDVSFSSSSEFFVTEDDLFATYKSLFEKKKNNKVYFDFVCCGGTKVYNVSEVIIYGEKLNDDNNNIINMNLDINENGEPNYFIYSSNRINNNKWSVTEVQNLFKIDEAGETYYEISTGIQLLNEEYGRINKNNCSFTYEHKNINGMTIKSRDEYGVITLYDYDSYGNLNKVKNYNETDDDNGEKLITEYNYSVYNESLREMPISINKNGITTNFDYYEPEFLTNYTLFGNSKTEYEYDEYKEKVLSINNKNNDENVNLTKNTFKYDHYGNIISASDTNGRTYGFVYNVFGETLKYYENSKLILEKEVKKESDIEIITEKLYNNQKVLNDEFINTPYVTTTKIDNYGRILEQINIIDDTENSKTISFNYQSEEEFKESPSVLKVTEINDPYDGQKYSYIYDNENRSSGYETSGNSFTGVDKTLVRQIGTGDTQYYFESDGKYFMSKIIRDDASNENPKYISPRIIKTKYVDMEEKDSDKIIGNYMEFSYNYDYDSLGRLKQKSGDDVPYINFDLINLYYRNKNDKVIKYKNGTVLPEFLEYLSTLSYQDSEYEIQKSSSIKYENTYDSRGNLTNVKTTGERFKFNYTSMSCFDKLQLLERNYTYKYDTFNRLYKEIRIDNNTNNCTIEYDYSQTSDHLRSVTCNGIKVKEFKYDKGKRISIKLNNDLKDILYDNYGNVIKDEKGNIIYNSRNLLSQYNYITKDNNINVSNNNIYKYNYQGVRYSKVINTIKNEVLTDQKKVYYFLDGSRILGEKQITSSDIKILKYLYDAEGISGINYNGYNFTFIKDSLGNVSKVMLQGKIIGEYVYDAWGNCTIVPLSVDDELTLDEEIFILYNNPFRWKSHYLDIETGLYYVNGRYYSPVLMMYLNAYNIENVNIQEINSYDRLAITLDNSISYEVNSDTIFTDNELYPDPKYEPILKKSWWELNWQKAVQWIAFATVLIVSIVLVCIPGTRAFGIGMLLAGLKASISGAVVGGIIGGVMNLVQGSSFMEGLLEGVLYGLINGFTTGALMFCASQAATALSKASNSRCTTPGNCFISGTLVLTSMGNKPIEEIEIGDEVWAYNEETGEKSLKKVVDLLRNKTKKWIHLLFELNDGKTEEIVCTEGHPFYVNDIGWVKSIDLLENDSILMYNNCSATLKQKDIEELEVEEVTYNFEAEDFHTYYVGENGILVHNKCKYRGGKYKPRAKDIAIDPETGLVQPTKGISVNTNPSKVQQFGKVTRIDSIPSELKFIKTGGPGHYEIVPKKAMTLERYQELLDQITYTYI